MKEVEVRHHLLRDANTGEELDVRSETLDNISLFHFLSDFERMEIREGSNLFNLRIRDTQETEDPKRSRQTTNSNLTVEPVNLEGDEDFEIDQFLERA